YVMVAVFSLGVPFTAFAALGAHITANGHSGSITINHGDTFTYEWSSTEATACTFSGPAEITGLDTSGSGGPIDPSHPWYPATGGSTTLTINCTDGVNSSSDSVTINVAAPTPLTVDVKANGSDGPVTINSGDSWTYEWSSTGATACKFTAPAEMTGLDLHGNGGPIAPG